MEEWAERQRRREGTVGASTGSTMDKEVSGIGARGEDDGLAGLGDLDGMEGGFQGMEIGQEGLFDGVPVGIREFMNTEKRLRERKERQTKGKA